MVTKKSKAQIARLQRMSSIFLATLALTLHQNVSSYAASDRIYFSSSDQLAPYIKVSVLKSDLQSLVSPTKSCTKSLSVYIEPQQGAIARNLDVNVFSTTYDQYDFVSKSVQSSQGVIFYFSRCGSASWRALDWNIVLEMAIQGPSMTNDGITTTPFSNKAIFKIQRISVQPNRASPTLKNIEIVSSSKSANIIVSSQERAADPPFTYEYKIVSPESQATNWTKVRGPIIGLTKLQSKKGYKLAVRAVSFDKVYGKTVFKQFSTK